jgi:hypothetical protein
VEANRDGSDRHSKAERNRCAGRPECAIDLADSLPRIKQVLQMNVNGLDTDLSHWHLVSFYAGDITWGSVGMSTHWTPIRITN